LYGQNSLWGVFDYHTFPDSTDFYYINMVARSGSAGTGSWVVQNLPLFPIASNDMTYQEMYFDLSDLGISDGTRLPSLEYYITVDASPLGAAPAGTFAPASVPSVVQRSNDNSDPIVARPAAPDGHKSLGPVTFAGDHHDGMEPVEEALNQCLAGAFARSIKWLDKKYDLPNLSNSSTAQDVYQTLAAKLPAGKDEARISSKAEYLKSLDPRAETKVHGFPSIPLDRIPNARIIESDYPFGWADGEMKTEDVEFAFRDGNDAHIVAVTQFYVQAPYVYAKYRDDSDQGNPTKGDDAEKDNKISCDSAGNCFFRGKQVQYFVSESVVPEPTALLLATSCLLIVPVSFRRVRCAL
jgi:hypothetical protein